MSYYLLGRVQYSAPDQVYERTYRFCFNKIDNVVIGLQLRESHGWVNVLEEEHVLLKNKLTAYLRGTITDTVLFFSGQLVSTKVRPRWCIPTPLFDKVWKRRSSLS